MQGRRFRNAWNTSWPETAGEEAVEEWARRRVADFEQRYADRVAHLPLEDRPAALAASKLVESFLYGMKRNDPFALAAAVLTMAGATLLAGYVPARNAAHVDPMAALRHE